MLDPERLPFPSDPSGVQVDLKGAKGTPGEGPGDPRTVTVVGPADADSLGPLSGAAACAVRCLPLSTAEAQGTDHARTVAVLTVAPSSRRFDDTMNASGRNIGNNTGSNAEFNVRSHSRDGL